MNNDPQDDNDCGDVGTTHISQGCHKCGFHIFVEGLEEVRRRPRILPHTDGFMKCETCKGGYGPIPLNVPHMVPSELEVDTLMFYLNGTTMRGDSRRKIQNGLEAIELVKALHFGHSPVLVSEPVPTALEDTMTPGPIVRIPDDAMYQVVATTITDPHRDVLFSREDWERMQKLPSGTRLCIRLSPKEVHDRSPQTPGPVFPTSRTVALWEHQALLQKELYETVVELEAKLDETREGLHDTMKAKNVALTEERRQNHIKSAVIKQCLEELVEFAKVHDIGWHVNISRTFDLLKAASEVK